jgi:DNA-binding LacI/PurR family transcriptional regulator
MTMPRLGVKSAREQVYEYLRGQIAHGGLLGAVPGVLRLEAELGVSRRAVMAALARLEKEGLVVGAGAGKRRRVAAGARTRAGRRHGMRVVILAYDEAAKARAELLKILHQLQVAGYEAEFAAGTIQGLGMDLKRVASQVEQIPADAWMVVAGSREILEWFMHRGVPVLAVFGRHRRLPIAGVGPHFAPAMEALARRLLDLGHRRIVLLVHRERRLPRPGPPERAFLGALAARGIVASGYHLPEWEEHKEGFRRCLESLFQLTPPTALVVAEPMMYFNAMQFLGERGLSVPRDVSMACLESDPVFSWSEPAVAQLEWDRRRLVHAAIHWLEQVAAGNDDRSKRPIKAVFIEGGTMGPAPAL